MTPFDKKDFLPVGTIVKPHGLRGEVVLEIEEGYEGVLDDPDYLLVEVEGGLVPFFVSEEGIRFRTTTTLCLSFDDLDSVEKVRPYCGCKIYVPKDVDKEPESNEEFNTLIGMTVFDEERGKLGKVIRVDDFSGNVVLTILYKSHEILVPLSEELIIRFDQGKKELHLDCPEGLIDLYLE
ncbi:MAG: ribosome maturation factor RimM [Prolixibacteraceae bacterium]|jgi:16S rRNA processing protein RimM|nr:ribosome maturation factor RimM [Prolixibacteraceae bacterium]